MTFASLRRSLVPPPLRSRRVGAGVVLALLTMATTAHAQPTHQPTTPLPGAQQPPATHYDPPPAPGYGQTPASDPDATRPPLSTSQAPGPSPSAPQPPPPPPTMTVTRSDVEAQVDPNATHAPKYALWVGARASYVGFGFSFYENNAAVPQHETTGNFLGNGVAPQVDVGVRIARRYLPYVFWEHGFMGQGHRFAGTDASSSTDFYGVGFRYVSGNVDSVGFLTDLSIGRRIITVSNGGQSYSMSGLEFFRLGLGAEIRLATLFAISPLASISSGALSDSKGEVAYGCAATTCADGQTRPTYVNGAEITTSRAYVVLSIGLGLHFDLFGK